MRQVAVTDPVALAKAGDYADAFEARLAEPDQRTPEEWVRDGLADSPPAVKRIVRLLGFRPGDGQPGQISGLRIVESTAEVVRLETSLRLLRVVMVGRRLDPTRRTLTTVLFFHRPVLARLVWRLIAPRHRRTAMRIVAGGVQSG
ncbi:hypothetical protein BJY16_005720 [Actinoplanes octamycinicus]|uniref:DUF2867 domain-containing protein n=1 Tax=Actinoplanes octamycinicus TaxID=135948 RepID=A0A7W7M9V2_9ACTN|nr:hypothetical protein [Actinoplanes octamycinicus]MBB4742261.1 hypothetical protein [Actinoplanes octamycinicus]GIE59894.1 hypothetical protein Aoc01nite_52960 [Actinoplanes octamycinicus]